MALTIRPTEKLLQDLEKIKKVHSLNTSSKAVECAVHLLLDNENYIKSLKEKLKKKTYELEELQQNLESFYHYNDLLKRKVS